jgi:uncharacterized low-complexity protein
MAVLPERFARPFREHLMTEHRKALGAALGAAVGVATLTGSAAAAQNPFGMTDLPGGYLQLAAEGTVGEGRSGSKPGKAAQESAGEKAQEGRCASKPTAGESAGEKPTGTKGTEMACGEGKCGAMMKKGG